MRFFIAAIFILFALFITPFVVNNDLYNGLIVAKEFWLIGVIVLIFLYWGISFIFQKGAVAITLTASDILLLLFYSYYLLRGYFTYQTPLLELHKIQILTACVVIYFFIKLEVHRYSSSNGDRNPFTTALIIFFLLSGLLEAAYGLLQLYGYYPSNHGLFKMTGSFFNPAPYALYLAIIFPLALAIYVFEKPIKEKSSLTLSWNSSLNFFTTPYVWSLTLKYTSIATLFLIAIVLPATMIRASWIGALTGAGVVMVLAYTNNLISPPTSVKYFFQYKLNRLLILTFTVLMIIGSALFIYKLKEGSSIGKSLIWEVTTNNIAEKPFLGHGVGRFEAEYNNWQANYFTQNPNEKIGSKGLAAGNTKYCFNDYLELTSEIGIIGLLLFLSFAGFTLLNTFNSKNKRKLLFLPLLITILVMSAISYPLYIAPILMLYFIGLGILSGSLDQIFKIQLYKRLNYILAISSFFIAATLSMALYLKYESYTNWLDASYAYNNGNYAEANKLYAAGFHHLSSEGIYLQEYGKSLQMSGECTKAIDPLKKATNLTSDYVLYCTLGDAYKAGKSFATAEEAYQYATAMVPHKIYPHYLLAKLYVCQGANDIAVAKANEVLNMQAKTKSIAVTEIKSEMKAIIKANSSSHDNQTLDSNR